MSPFYHLPAVLLFGGWLVACAARPAAPAHVARMASHAPIPTKLLRITPRSPINDSRQLVIGKARELMSKSTFESEGLTFETDPVGFVRAAYWSIGLDLFHPDVAADNARCGMLILYKSMQRWGRLHKETPRPGDLVFLANHPATDQTAPAQVLLIEHVKADGTVVAVGQLAKGPARIRLNLRDSSDTGSNTLLEGETRALAATLFHSFATPL